MKNLLNYYYNIYPDQIYKYKDYYYFYINNIKYILNIINRNDLEFLINISNNLYNNNILVHTFIKTRDNNYVVNYDNKKYVLLRINYDDNKKVRLKDINTFNRIKINGENRNYIKLWSKEIDDIEEEISDFNKEHELIMDTIDYYIGLNENAIEYYKDNIDIENNPVSLSHINLDYNMKYIDFYNPLNFIIDYRVRDISEYIKSLFFNNVDNNRIINIIKSLNINRNESIIIFCRLLYPNYYYKIYNDILDKKIEEKELYSITNLSIKYEILLNRIQNIFHKKYNMPIIEWIRK